MKHEIKTYIIYDDCECGGELETIGFKGPVLCLFFRSGKAGYINKCKRCGKEVISDRKSGFIVVENDDGKLMKLFHTGPKKG